MASVLLCCGAARSAIARRLGYSVTVMAAFMPPP
jgi:hypothetical protein